MAMQPTFPTFLESFKANILSGYKKLTTGKSDSLTSDEKQHLGMIGGVVVITTIIASYAFFRSNKPSSPSNFTKQTADKVVTVLPSSSPTSASTPAPTKSDVIDTDLHLVEEGLKQSSHLAASPSSDEDQSTSIATPSTSTSRQMEFNPVDSSTPNTSMSGTGTGSGSGSETDSGSDYEEEEEARVLTLSEAMALMDQLVNALDQFHDDNMVNVYGSFVSCLISMQKIFQRYDWGYAEWPDVVSALDAHSGNSEYDMKWNTLQEKLKEHGFPSIPIFKNDLTKDELLKVMEEMLAASAKVAKSVQTLKTQGDSIIDAHHIFNEQKTRASYEEWRRQCTDDEFQIISSHATFPEEDMVSVPKKYLKDWKDQYLVRVMLTMMTPLTKLQEDNMKKYGIGATHFQQQVWKYAGDAEVADIKHQLEHMMTLIHPTASDTEETSGSDSTY